MLKKRVGIVAVSKSSFRYVKESLLYANPVDYHMKSVDYLAFYRLKPVSAVTHYGEVSEIESNVHYSRYFRRKPLWLKRNIPLNCYHLEWLRELPHAVGRTEKHNAVIGPVYTSLQTLLKAKTLTDIFD